ncbi:MAG: hypothetical protein JWM68_3303 [Verrucomicrobiales bacterium]|nr:hypothetical protein [Verrucomicrobiales bacterium]
MNIKLHTKLFTSAVVLSSGVIFTACSSMHKKDTSYSGSQMSEPSGASASSQSEWKRGKSGQMQGSYYSAGASSSSSSQQYQSGQSQTQSQSQNFDASQSEVSIPLYEETVNVGKRTVDAGEVVLRKVITTETVNQPVELRRETIVIDHIQGDTQRSSAKTAASSSSASGSPFQEKTFTIRLQREEPVIQKQTIVKGNVVARRNAQTERNTISEQIRKEDVQVDQSGAASGVVLHGNFYEINEGAGAQPRSSSSSQPQGQSESKDQQQQDQQQPQQDQQ